MKVILGHHDALDIEVEGIGLVYTVRADRVHLDVVEVSLGDAINDTILDENTLYIGCTCGSKGASHHIDCALFGEKDE